MPFLKRISAALIQLFQRKIGSFIYAIIIIKSNIVFAIFYFAKFLLNLNNTYYKAANKAIAYIINFVNYAIKYNSLNKFFKVYNNTLFANNTINCRSF